MIAVGRKIICFVKSNCHFIFMLLVEGNIVGAVEYVSHMKKYRLSNVVIPINVGKIMLLFFVLS